MNLTPREQAAILAGLRLLQQEMDRYGYLGGPRTGREYVDNVLTNNGEWEGLFPSEISNLCIRLKLGKD